ncbi:MAG TPA: XRE family transcriptional regulator [Planctomycetota bacterium]|nr:XRE family transcriptional regulator [Planctomycetota bacterium]
MAETIAPGSIIRTLRVQKGLRLDDLASRSGFTKGFLSKIENGRASPPIATLMRIAEALRVNVAELLHSNGQVAAKKTICIRADQRPKVAGSNAAYTYWALAAERAHKLMEPYVIRVAPEDVDPQQTFQHRGEEFILVLEGRVRYRVGDEHFEMGPGDSLYFDGDEPHAPLPLGGPVTFVAIFSAAPARPRGPAPKQDKKKRGASS